MALALAETPPFPYFGGKRRIAPTVWEYLGNVPNYVEPFAGSLAVLLQRPHPPKIETVNDIDGLLVNAWRGIKLYPEETAKHADWPVTELDQLARHDVLLRERDTLTASLRADPDYCDTRLAGWWVWGANIWIGGGWGQRSANQIPHLGAGKGINRKLPHLGDAGEGIHYWFAALSERLRRVRITNGSWDRVLGPSVTTNHGITGVYFDPPYEHHESTYGRNESVSESVREWCLMNGSDPHLRIVLSGYSSEHDELLKHGWIKHQWKAQKGYQAVNDDGTHSGHNEALWVSPACILQPTLFSGEVIE